MSGATGACIRAARPEDAETLTHLAIAAKASWGYPADWVERWREELTITPDYVRANRVLVAEDEAGSVLGMIAIGTDGGRAEIQHLWVDPSAQRRGIGAALLRAVLADASSVPLRILSDPNAAAFYRRHGARDVGSVAAPMPGAPQRVLPVLVIERWRDA